MTLLRKFLILTLLPLVVILPAVLFTNNGSGEVKNTSVILFSISFFTIVSFNAVYISNFFNLRKFSAVKTFCYSGLISFISVFVFAVVFMFFFKSEFHLNVVLSQAVMGFCVFILEYLVLFILSKKSSNSIKFEDKNWQYLLLVLIIILIEFALFSLITFSSVRSFDDFTKSFSVNKYMLVFMFLTPIFAFTFIRLSVKFRCNAVLTILISSVLSSLATFLIVNISVSSISKIQFRFGPILVTYLIGLFCTLSIYAFLYYRTQIKEKAKLKYKVNQKDARYLELKNQLNPHFLFNNLNTMISFIEINPKKAIEFGHHLSNVYRYYLKSQQNDFVTVSDELDFIEDYLSIYKAKFEKGIDYEIVSDELDDFYMIANCLQEVIDNIFKHNIADNENELKITIKVENDKLVVTNSVIRNNSVVSNGIGLENISKRHEYLTGSSVLITNNDKKFTVTLPLFKIE